MPPRRRPSEPSPFAALEQAFAVCCAPPRPLALDGAGIAGLPDRPVPLGELKARLLHPSTPYAVRDGALGVLIARAKTEGGGWTVGLAGVLLPGLRRALEPLAETCPAKQADLEAEMLAGLLAALARCPAGRRRPAGFLCGRAYDAAKQLVRKEMAERGCPARRAISAEPPKPFGHPDLVLARAVGAGVVCSDDAELIGPIDVHDGRLVQPRLRVPGAVRTRSRLKTDSPGPGSPRYTVCAPRRDSRWPVDPAQPAR